MKQSHLDKLTFLKLASSGVLDECIEWPWSKRSGYGRIFDYHGKGFEAHRFALAFKLKKPERDIEMALHKCDNRGCVNGDHLYEGNNTDNMRDKVLAGKHHNKVKTRCSKGHSFSGDNLIIYYKNGVFRKRKCRECRRERQSYVNARQRKPGGRKNERAA